MILLTKTVDLLKQMKVWERDVGKENEQEEKSGGKKLSSICSSMQRTSINS